MASAPHQQNLVLNQYEPSQKLKTASFVCTGIGALGLLVGLIKFPDQLWPAYLTAFFYVSLLGLGGMFFTVIQHIAKAGWSSSIRRLSEGMASFIPVMLGGALLLILLGGVKHLYQWADPEFIQNNPIVAAKTSYLNVPFLVVRVLVFGLGMALFAHKIVGHSTQQDTDGKEEHTHKNVGLGIAYILFFAITFSLFTVDLVMSLLPTWYSTIFGIYCFAGSFQSALAFLILLMLYVRHKGYVQGYYNNEHIHDVAKYLKGFTVFWAYIAFSQFMLIWYANIPEETEYYLMRAEGSWMAISFSLLILKFIVPFLALLPKAAKRNTTHLILVCTLILIMQYVDVYWMIYPNFFGGHPRFSFFEISQLLGFMGIFLICMQKFFQKNKMVAIKDPRLHEALNHHVTY